METSLSKYFMDFCWVKSVDLEYLTSHHPSGDCDKSPQATYGSKPSVVGLEASSPMSQSSIQLGKQKTNIIQEIGEDHEVKQGIVINEIGS